ncbi:FecCD family ABC transporter permease [Dermatophilus congolensis]|nr:iron chelate uptake ABC transporter family permease subunit [Dermatophilus congolensis]
MSSIMPTTNAKDIPPPTVRPPFQSRRVVFLASLIVALFFIVLASLMIGTKDIPLRDVLSALTGSSEGDSVIVSGLRLPRTFLGLAAGAALGAAGAIAQNITRNPLGDPGLIGISAGAAFSVAAAIGILGLASPSAYVWFAFLGGAIAGVLAYAVGGTGQGGATPAKLALAGAAVTVLSDSATHTLVLLDVRTLDQYRSWAVGALAGRGPDVWSQVAPIVVVGLVLAFALSGPLNALDLGDDLAASLGTRVAATRALGAVAVILLTGASVAAIGPVTFVGLVVPHVVRAYASADLRWSIPCSALGGALLLLGADVIGRLVARPGELEAGVVTALVGAPFLVFLVKSGRLKEHTR